jgi:uncharacterized protein YbcV (DUF1398 family)
MFTGISYNIINKKYAETYPAASFISWTADSSTNGHWGQVVNVIGSNTKTSSGALQFYPQSTGFYSIQNYSINNGSDFMNPTATAGDGTNCHQVEFSQYETSNTKSEAGAFKFELNQTVNGVKYYNLVNKTYGSTPNDSFLSYETED